MHEIKTIPYLVDARVAGLVPYSFPSLQTPTPSFRFSKASGASRSNFSAPCCPASEATLPQDLSGHYLILAQFPP